MFSGRGAAANARHGALLQLGALLTHASTARVGADAAALLALCEAALPRLLQRCGARMRDMGAAAGAAALSAANAALSVARRPDQCAALRALSASAAEACARAVAAAASDATASTDWHDPMLSVLLKHAAHTWVGHALVTEALCLLVLPEAGLRGPGAAVGPMPQNQPDVAAAPIPPREPDAGAGPMLREGDEGAAERVCALLVSRLRACLGSASYDVRASALKALLPLLAALAAAAAAAASAGVAHNGIHAGSSAAAAPPASPSGKPPLPSAAALAHKCGTLALALLLRTREGGGAVPQLAAQLQGLLWAHLADEPTLKVRGRCLRALALLQSAAGPLAQLQSATGPMVLLQSTAGPLAQLQPGRAAGSGDGVLVRPARDTVHGTVRPACDAAGGDATAHLVRVRRLCERAAGVDARAAAMRCLGHALGTATAQLLGPVANPKDADAAAAAAASTNSVNLPELLPEMELFVSGVGMCTLAEQVIDCRVPVHCVQRDNMDMDGIRQVRHVTFVCECVLPF